MNIFRDYKKVILAFSSIFVIILYGYVGFTSYGFDDEFFNIGIVENFSAYEIFYLDASINSNHPNGSILLNSLVFKLFNDWSYVRAFYGVIFASTLLFSFICLSNNNKNFNYLIFFILLCLNPSLLIIGSSIRWYSAFIIFFNLLVILVYKNSKNSCIFWSTFLILAQFLLHINYLAFLVVPIIFLYSLNHRKSLIQKNTKELGYLIFFILLSLIIAFPEINSFVYKLSLDQSSQFSPFWLSILGLGIFHTSGLAFMPNSFPMLFSIILIFFMLTVFLLNLRKQPIKFFLVYFFISILIVLSGLAGKFRTFYAIHILDAYIKSQVLSLISKKWHPLIVIALVIPAIAGYLNVVNHQATNKSSWNMPYMISLNEVSSLVKQHDCKQVQIFLHDPGLAWHFKQQGYDVFNLYSMDNLPNLSLNSEEDCQIYLKTFRGSMNRERKQMFDSFFDSKPGLVKKINIKKDPFLNIKKKLNREIPKYYVELSLYKKTNS